MTAPVTSSVTQLPNAGSGIPLHSTSSQFLLIAGILSAGVGLTCAALGLAKKPETENDRITNVKVPIRWV
ncbi:MAG: hypothetical protein ACYDCQ_13690 [Dehalococcoidia bacterium]|jgi:hypothetical protein